MGSEPNPWPVLLNSAAFVGTLETCAHPSTHDRPSTRLRTTSS